MLTPRASALNPWALFRAEPFPGPGSGNKAYLSQFLPRTDILGGGNLNRAQISLVGAPSFNPNAQASVTIRGGGNFAGEMWQQPLST